MKTKATVFVLACLIVVGLVLPAQAQQREDVYWVRFMGDASITLDGVLDEAVWNAAEVVDIKFGENAGLPGSGWFVQNLASGLEAPLDPPEGTVRMLAKGDSLYVAVTVKDKSIGGSSTKAGFNWNWDSIFMPFSDKSAFGPSGDGFHHFPQSREFMVTWWNNVDTTATGAPLPGVGPMLRGPGAFGVNQNFSVMDSSRTADQRRNWDAGVRVNGTSNEDTHGDDVGYVVEMRINLAALGYDIDSPFGEQVQTGVAIHDADYYWPGNPEKVATSRAWYQGQWANNFNSGSIKLFFDPFVRVGSGALPMADADIIIPNAGNHDAPEVDGVLDESVWGALSPGLEIQYGNEDLMASWPSTTSLNSGYFRPGAKAEVPVVDPSLAKIKWFFQGDKLYLGVDVDDQSVDSTRGEGGDGIRFTINDRTLLTGDRFLQPREFIVTVGPDGQARLDGVFASLPEGSYMVGASLKGASTVGDVFDVDEGYQFEIMLDLPSALGYPVGRGDGALYLSAHTFDHDIFEDAAQNYNVRTWWTRERGAGPPAFGYMDPNTLVPGSGTPMLSEGRDDALWVPFMGDASVSLDGVLNEPIWSEAAVKHVAFGKNAGLPGSGWFVQNLASGLEAPLDPPEGTVRMLAKGDSLYVAVTVKDKSIGGSSTKAGFNWNWDSIFMPFSDKSAFGPSGDGFHHFPQSREFMVTWWNNVDTTATGAPLPGVGPMLRGPGAFGVNQNFSVMDSSRTADQRRNWDAGVRVNGTSNEDTHGDDVGYVVEMRINLAALGYDLDGGGTEQVQTGFAIHDADYYWPGNPEKVATSRAWYQGQWANNFNSGSIKLFFDPTVTVGTTPPTLAPDIIIPDAGLMNAPTVDGALDEAVWQAVDTGLEIQYGNEDLMASWPSTTSLNSGYFRPGAKAEVPVVDPSLAKIKWFFQGDKLYLGVDVDDQSVDSTRGEGGDGIRFTINDRTLLTGDRFLQPREFIVTVGPDGQARLDGVFASLPEGSYMVGASLKGASTVGDVFDVDEGYQFEIMLDLPSALGYPVGRGDGALFLSAHTFDHDIFEDAAQNYNVRTWWTRERGAGPPAFALMDPNVTVGIGDELAEIPRHLTLDGNYPNPFNPSTTMRYLLPSSGEVEIEVYDVLGRRVAQLTPGLQAAGAQQVHFDASHLASGLYLYRVTFKAAAARDVQHVQGRMVLVK